MSDSPKVVGLNGLPAPEFNGEVNPELVKLCEQVLDDVKSGRIVGMVLGLNDTRNGYISVAAGNFQFTHMLGTLDRMKFDIHCRWTQMIVAEQTVGNPKK